MTRKCVVTLQGVDYVDMTAEEEAAFEAARAPQPAPIAVVSMRQARLALLQSGLLAQVDAAVAADDVTRITWDYATEVRRDHPLLASIAAALDLTDQQVDDLFALARTFI